MMNINDVQVMTTPDHGSYTFSITQPPSNIEQSIKDVVREAMNGNPHYTASQPSDNSELNFVNIPFGDGISTLMCNWTNTEYDSTPKLFNGESIVESVCEQFTKTFGVKWYRRDELQYSTITDKYYQGIISTDNGITIRERNGMLIIIFFKGCVTTPSSILNQDPQCKVTYFWWMDYISMLLKQHKFEKVLEEKIYQLKLKAEKEVFKTT